MHTSLPALTRTQPVRAICLGVAMLLVAGGGLFPSPAWPQAETPNSKWNLPYVPYEGQEGKDVVWVPTPEALVEKMLDMADVTAGETVVDLGSGDGRTVIAAAKRGAKARGIEYNPDLVRYARQRANEAGVADQARFEAADIFESDFSDAQVITMFLLPSLNERLRPTLLDLKPGTRIVSNSFGMGDWPVDDMATLDNCSAWCTAMLWVVPAKVGGRWRTDGGDELVLDQRFQLLDGRLGDRPITMARLHGDDIVFFVDGRRYTGTVNGNTISGRSATGGAWSATRQ